MIQVIELSKIDELLEEYNTFKNEGESFGDFIRVSKCTFDDSPDLFDWVYVNAQDINEVWDNE